MYYNNDYKFIERSLSTMKKSSKILGTIAMGAAAIGVAGTATNANADTVNQNVNAKSSTEQVQTVKSSSQAQQEAASSVKTSQAKVSSASSAVQSSKAAVSSAQTNVDNAQKIANQKNTQLTKAQQNANDASKASQTQSQKVSSLQSQVSSQQKTVDQASSSVASAQSQVNSDKSSVASAQSNLNNDKNEQSKLNNMPKTIQNDKNQVSQDQSKVDQDKQNVSSAQSNVDNAESKEAQAQKNVDSAQSSVDNAQSALNNAKNNESNISSKLDGVKAQLNGNDTHMNLPAGYKQAMQNGTLQNLDDPTSHAEMGTYTPVSGTQVVNPSDLTNAEQQTLTTYAAQVINSLRQQYGSPLITPNQHMIDDADKIVSQTNIDNVKGTHDWNALNNVYNNDWSLSSDAENMGAGIENANIPGNPTPTSATMDQLKNLIYNDIRMLVSQDSAENWGHAKSLLDVNGYENEILGIDVDKYGYVHFEIGVPLTIANR